MKSAVYLIRVSDNDSLSVRQQKLSALLDQSRLVNFIKAGDTIAVKLHFGEEGNTGYVKPAHVQQVCSRIKEKNAQALVSDTNTLYRGRRLVAEDHLKLAHEHGFTDEELGARVVIADEKAEGGTTEIAVNGAFVEKAKVASLFVRADGLVGVAHFKGHIMTGFGGALKNIGMGCASREGKLFQHSDVSPVVCMSKCTGCGACQSVCPAQAITLVEHKSRIDAARCIGCASCIAACVYNAIDVAWEQGGDSMQEKMIEYASAILSGKAHKKGFINFAVKITKECDCLAKDDPKISPDVGFLASDDPLALDKATLNVITAACGHDVFTQEHPERDGTKQLLYARKLKIGNLDYELKEVH
jgi:hypothetical protein